MFDFYDPTNNDWLAVNEVTVTENRYARRSGAVLSVNGLPFCVVGSTNSADEESTVWTAYG